MRWQYTVEAEKDCHPDHLVW
jgi:hypothetical protein